MFNSQNIKAICNLLPIQLSDNKNKYIAIQFYLEKKDEIYSDFLLSKIRQSKLDIVTSDEYQMYGIIPEQTLFEKDCELYNSLNLDSSKYHLVKKSYNILEYSANYNSYNKNPNYELNYHLIHNIDEIISKDISEYVKINMEFLQYLKYDYTSILNNKYEQFRIIRSMETSNPKFVLIPLSLKHECRDFIEQMNNCEIYYMKYIDKIVVGFIKPLVTIDITEIVSPNYETQYLMRVGVIYEDIMPFRCFYPIL